MKLRVSCFGKLRIFADFVEPTHRTGFSDELRQWLVAATAASEPSSSQQEDGETQQCYRVVWPHSRGKKLLVAILWNSRDQVGRSFPFCVYTELPVRKLRLERVAALPLVLDPLWDQLLRIASNGAGQPWVELEGSQLDVTEVQQKIKKARLDFDPKSVPEDLLEKRLVAIEAERFATCCLGPDGRALWPHMVAGLENLGMELLGAEPLIALRLPGTQEIDSRSQAAFWLRLIETLAGGDAGALPSLFLSVGDGGRTGLWLLFREPLQADLPLLFGDGPAHDYLLDLRLREKSPSAAELGVAPPNAAEGLEWHPGMTCLELAQLSRGDSHANV